MKLKFRQMAGVAMLVVAGNVAVAQETNSSTNTSGNAVAESSTGPRRASLNSFQIIETRNIFDPNRRAIRPVQPRGPTVRVEYFGLTGAMTYGGDQAFAFFDGTGVSRGRAFKPSEKINGYTIAGISNNTVRLDAGSNTFLDLSAGMQLRRENSGPWKVVPTSVPASDSGVSEGASGDSTGEGTAASTTTLSGPDADVIRKLMEKRAAEMRGSTTDSAGSTGEGTNDNH